MLLDTINWSDKDNIFIQFTVFSPIIVYFIAYAYFLQHLWHIIIQYVSRTIFCVNSFISLKLKGKSLFNYYRK